MSSMLFGDAVTLYNHHQKQWFKTVLEGVQWTEKTTKTVDPDGKIHVVPEVGITVPYRDGYTPPEEYAGEGFTFGLDNLDVVVLGDYPEEITGSYAITNLRKDYAAATIYAAQDNTLRPLLKHWQVMAR